MSIYDLYLLSPEICVVALAALVICVDLTVTRKGLLTWVAVVGLSAPVVFVVMLMGDLSGWWNVGGNDLNGSDSFQGVSGTLTIDRFALFFKALFIGSVGLVILCSDRYAERFSSYRAEYFALLLIASAGMMLLASVQELITLYVALELATLPLVALAAFLGDSRSSEAGLKMLLLSALSSGLILYGMALIYGFVGTTEFVAIGNEIVRGDEPFGGPVLLLATVLVIAGLGFKIATVPFQMWIPDVYEGSPTPVTAFLSVASKSAGFAALLRVFLVAFAPLVQDWSILFGVLAAASMTIGNFAAIAQSNIKRMLAYSTIAQAGYIMVALAAFHGTGLQVSIGTSALLFYLGGYTATNLTAFFAIIAITNQTDSETIDDLAGLGRRAPFLALALALGLISLTGLPPTVGFMGKLFVFGAAMQSGMVWLVVIGLLNSVVSAYYYLRVVRTMYISKSVASTPVDATVALKVALAVTGGIVVLLGVWPSLLLNITDGAALAVLP